MRTLKILYFSCHEILEYDDLSMFTQAGHTVFSLGAYASPAEGTKALFRKGNPRFYNEDLVNAFKAHGCDLISKSVTPDFCKLFDVAIVNHYPHWVEQNLDALSEIPVIMRTIGQSSEEIETGYRNLAGAVKIVRYSYREVGLPGFTKTDAVIYFSKKLDDYVEWRGGGPGLTLQHHFKQRNDFGIPKWADWEALSTTTTINLFGDGNEDCTSYAGLAKPEQLSSLMANAAFYLYVYTYPPSYTLSLIEALAAGMPIIAPSAKFAAVNATYVHGGIPNLWRPERYEVEAILSGVGLVYDSINEAAHFVDEVAKNPLEAKAISKRARERAHLLFSPGKILAEWEAFIRTVI